MSLTSCRRMRKEVDISRGWMSHLAEENEKTPDRAGEAIMNGSMLIRSQLLATKLFVPTAPGVLISRPRLTALLQQSLKYPLTLISPPACFAKTTLLSTWIQSLSTNHPLVAWV